MSKKFIEAMDYESNFTTTENNAIALKSTNSSLVDLFGQIGALRNRSDDEIIHAFSKAFAEDKLIATKILFYARDIRNGGIGERKVFRSIIKYMAKVYPNTMRKNIHNIPVFGRWDDLYELVFTPLETDMFEYMYSVYVSDIINRCNKKPITMLAKWLKSVNTSSKESRTLGKLTAKNFCMSESEYRKSISNLRKYLDVVEIKMSAKEWNDIKYSSVPSKAMSIYRKAYQKHDPEGFAKYMENVSKGTEKINASTLFPYDILIKMGLSTTFGTSGANFKLREYDVVLEEQWKALPNYVEGENNILIMADTSGSMEGRPIATSIGLAIYFAERNKGVFKDKFITFSESPSFVTLKGNTLQEKIKCVPAIVQNTNLEKAMQLILDVAVSNNLTNQDMPKALVVISDMQFDSCQSYNIKETWHETMKKKFKKAGFELPNIVYWNVESRLDTFQVTANEVGVQLASGQSPSVFKSITVNLGKTPYEAMLNVLNNPVYDCITV
jgi:hypothetical protein